MDIDHERTVETTPLAPPATVVATEPIATEAVTVATPMEREVRDVRTSRTVSLPALIAGALAVAMVILGGALVARAGVDDPLDEPIVSVIGVDGSAIGGIVLVALGLGLLIAAATAARGAILFFSAVIGIAAAVLAIEPSVADGSLGFTRAFAVLLAVAAGVVALVAALVPTVRHEVRRVEQI